MFVKIGVLIVWGMTFVSFLLNVNIVRGHICVVHWLEWDIVKLHVKPISVA
jgi:hypothetical protein